MRESQYNDQIIKCGSKSDQTEHFLDFLEQIINLWEFTLNPHRYQKCIDAPTSSVQECTRDEKMQGISLVDLEVDQYGRTPTLQRGMEQKQMLQWLPGDM